MKKHFMVAFEEFFASPTHHKLEELLRSHGGEFDCLDFKADWPHFSKVARHILAIGNSGGGVLVVGVEELPKGGLKAQGLEHIEDKADVHKRVSKYLPKQMKWNMYDFFYAEGDLSGKKFQVVVVEYQPHVLPLVSEASGEGIRKAAVYVRRGTSSEEADYHELQQIVNARIETGHSSAKVMTLQEHLDELQALYQQIPIYTNPFARVPLPTSNPDYPKESYDQFIAKLIERKKQIIEVLISTCVPSASHCAC